MGLEQDFANETTFHGIKHAAGSGNIILRSFWVLAILASLVFLVYQTLQLGYHFGKFEAVSEVTVQVGNRPHNWCVSCCVIQVSTRPHNWAV